MNFNYLMNLLQVKREDLVSADYEGINGGWGDDNPSVFLVTISGGLQGEYQLTNGYGPNLAPQVLQVTCLYLIILR